MTALERDGFPEGVVLTLDPGEPTQPLALRLMLASREPQLPAALTLTLGEPPSLLWGCSGRL